MFGETGMVMLIKNLIGEERFNEFMDLAKKAMAGLDHINSCLDTLGAGQKTTVNALTAMETRLADLENAVNELPRKKEPKHVQT